MTETYFGDTLGSFANGVQLDLRVKLAVDFLKSPVMGTFDGTTLECATWALDLAGALLDIAAERGLIKDLPDDGELNAPMRRHLERQVRAQIYQQKAAQRIQSEPEVALNSHPATLVPRRQ